MICDILPNASRYLGLHPLLPRAFAFLKEATTANLPRERTELSGANLYAMPFANVGRKRSEAPLEIHRRYIDVHYVLAGVEEIGWKAGRDCRKPQAPFDPEKDMGFFEDTPDGWITLHPGQFCILWPEEAHAPLVSEGCTKLVVKILATAGS